MLKMAKQLRSFDKNQLFESSLKYLKGKSSLDFATFEAAVDNLISKLYIYDSK